MTKKLKIIAIDFEFESINSNVFCRIEKFRQIIEIEDIQNCLFWKMYQNEFENCFDNYFESLSKIRLNAFRTWFKKQSVWIQTNLIERIFFVQTLINVVKKKTQSEWSKKNLNLLQKWTIRFWRSLWICAVNWN